MIAAMRPAHQRLAVQATVSGILATAVTLLWAATGGGSFWPKWVWLGLAIPMGLHAALFGARQVKSRRARAIATHGAISGVISGTLILIWAFAGFGFFWPLIPITVLAALLGLHAALAGIFWRPDEEELVERVDELTRTRRGALDVQAHELRRIERDLHDGAQARLVALTMQLGRAEARLEDHPEAARAGPRGARRGQRRDRRAARPRARDRPARARRPRPAGGRRGARRARADQDDRRRGGRAPAAAGRRDRGLLRRRRVDHQRRQARRARRSRARHDPRLPRRADDRDRRRRRRRREPGRKWPDRVAPPGRSARRNARRHQPRRRRDHAPGPPAVRELQPSELRYRSTPACTGSARPCPGTGRTSRSAASSSRTS